MSPDIFVHVSCHLSCLDDLIGNSTTSIIFCSELAEGSKEDTIIRVGNQ